MGKGFLGREIPLKTFKAHIIGERILDRIMSEKERKKGDMIDWINEAVNAKLKSKVLNMIDEIDNDEDLLKAINAMAVPVMEKMIHEACDKKKIIMGRDEVTRGVIAFINKYGENVEQQFDFLKEFLDGKSFDAKGLVKGSSGKVDNAMNYITSAYPIMSKMYSELVNWTPKVHNANIGPGELLFILATDTGAKGDAEDKGDAYLGRGLNIEMKSDGGHLGTSSQFNIGKEVFKDAFKDLGKVLKEKDLDDLMLRNGKARMPKALSDASKLFTELYKANHGGTQFQADKACEKLYTDVCDACMGITTSYKFNKVVKDGFTNPNIFLQNWCAAAYQQYEAHGFDWVTLFNKKSGATISFDGHAHFFKNRNNWDSDWHLMWAGGGQKEGGASTRIIAQPFQAQPISTDVPGDVEKIEELKDLRSALDHAIKNMPKKNFTVKHRKTLGLESINTAVKVLKNLDLIKTQTKEGLKRYFAHKKDLGMRDRKDITFGIAFKKWAKTL